MLHVALLLSALTLNGASARPVAVVLQDSGKVTLAWNPPTAGTPVSYNVHFGTTQGNYPNVVNAGLVTQWTSALLPPNPYYFVVTAVFSDGTESGNSNEVFTTSGQGDPCAVLGATPVSIFVTEMRTTTGAVGSQIGLYFKIGSPAAPVNDIMTTINGIDTDPGDHATGRQSGGVWFTAPSVPGTYSVVVTVTNTSGCKAVGTVDATGALLSFTVK